MDGTWLIYLLFPVIGASGSVRKGVLLTYTWGTGESACPKYFVRSFCLIMVVKNVYCKAARRVVAKRAGTAGIEISG